MVEWGSWADLARVFGLRGATSVAAMDWRNALQEEGGKGGSHKAKKLDWVPLCRFPMETRYERRKRGLGTA